ncbi:AAA-type ATPase lid domain-containing protein [Planctomicrobium piriforme]|uniref:Transcriptional regulator containing PAS, AAA-type ATPase, and DNA-binding Fis domains n=1 Tax=Planctomicrobium piriforme TaxID=1576369 RepID=A0A1I3FZ68_9PLAN|nr:sigma 54-interacting transcriptional regulator [Planctomicrobium piriforme]SFI16515.1 Transcriptional regulator containing PAS, AAA-type ATPase, and DNA-binding Fis domains [Planctomicrobium piriforme]
MSTRPRRGLATWLTTSLSPLFVLDDRRVVLVFNRGCEELTQWPAAEIIGKTCLAQATSDPTHAASVTGVLCPPEFLPNQMFASQPVVLHRRDGTILEREIHFFRLHPEDSRETGHFVGLIAEPATTAPFLKTSRRLDVARHTAELYERYRVERLIAKSPAMQRVAAQIEIARQTVPAVHLIGPRGCGKEHVARLIHYGSQNRQQRFVPIRCDGSSHFEISRTLNRIYESDEAQPVTIYLDQVDALPLDLQERVLAQMNRGVHRHLSSSQSGLVQLDERRMNPELKLRLTSLIIEVPALRDRGDDLLLLAQQLLEEQNQPAGLQHQGFSTAVERLFRQYNWPGEVDELARVVTQAARKASSAIVDVADLPADFAAGFSAQAIRPLPVRLSLEEQLAVIERQKIEQALEEARSNKSVAAEILQMPRARLYRRMAALGLAIGEDDEIEREKSPESLV